MLEWLVDMSEPFDEFALELVNVLAHSEDQVVTRLRARGNSKAGGPEFELIWGCVWTFRNRRVTRVEGLRTAEEALEAAGLSE
jgi:hypothetical protein